MVNLLALSMTLSPSDGCFVPTFSTHFRCSLRGFVGEEPIKINNGAFGTFFVATEKIFSLR
jgi:hypothetical protein